MLHPLIFLFFKMTSKVKTQIDYKICYIIRFEKKKSFKYINSLTLFPLLFLIFFLFFRSFFFKFKIIKGCPFLSHPSYMYLFIQLLHLQIFVFNMYFLFRFKRNNYRTWRIYFNYVNQENAFTSAYHRVIVVSDNYKILVHQPRRDFCKISISPSNKFLV